MAEGSMGTASPDRLGAELEFYEAHKADWLTTEAGRFVVIKGSQLLGFFEDFHSAYCTGAEKYGVDSDFLVKRVALQEPVFVVF
jgi:hypothetical protein